MRSALLPLSLLYAGALLIGGCGDDGGGGPEAPPGGKVVDMKDTRFMPERIELRVGQTVRWHNSDSIPHNATADDERFRSPNLDQGEQFDWTADKPGTVHYVCTLHPGQEGDLVITR